MTVRELIEWLQQQPEDIEVYHKEGGAHCGIFPLERSELRVACLDPDDEEAVIIG